MLEKIDFLNVFFYGVGKMCSWLYHFVISIMKTCSVWIYSTTTRCSGFKNSTDTVE